MASFGNYLLHNLFGNWNAGTWNVLPAVLTTWSNLLNTQGNKTSYELYREQAKNYKETAEQNAKLIEQQGAIALRNLQYKNKLQRGNDVLRIAVSGGNMSGTNLDIVARKEKIRAMNEMALKGNYQNQIMMELSNGYRKAAMTYGELAAKAGADKYGALASILKGLEVYVGLSVRDAKVQSEKQAQKEVIDYDYQAATDYTNYRYGKGQYEKKTRMSGDYVERDSNPLNTENNLLLAATDNNVNSTPLFMSSSYTTVG